MKLKDTFICIECEEIFAAGFLAPAEGKRVEACPSCGGAAFARLSRWVMTMSDYEKRGGLHETVSV